MRARWPLLTLFVVHATAAGCGEVVEVLGPVPAGGEGGASSGAAGVAEGGEGPAGAGGDVDSGTAGAAGSPSASGAPGASGTPGASGSGAAGAPGRPEVVRLDSGYSHACAVLDGALYCWGQNQRGRLGVGDSENRLRPTRVGADSDWSDVTTGSEHSCALKLDGSVYCFGSNDKGQIGVAGVNDVLSPLRVELPGRVRSLSAEVEFTCAVLEDGSLFCWGANIEGQLGQDDDYPGVDSPSPLRVTEFSDYLAVDAGQGHACSLRSPGTPYCWGRNTDSQLGLGDGAPQQTRVPGMIADAVDFSAVSAGQNHSCAVRGAGELLCWGGNAHGNLGTGDLDRRDLPTTILDQGIAAVSLDTFHTCALDTEQALSCWGRNVEGQLGVGDTGDRLAPAAVPGRRFEQVAVGRFFTCAVDLEHTLFCTGANESGQLGFGDTERRAEFEPLAYPFE